LEYIKEAIESGKISGNGQFTRKCQQFFEERFGFGKCLLTSSCTDALEMCALLLDIKEGDEIIMPSYTFVSTANAFMLRGAKIVFADSSATHPNMTVDIEALITPKTKAIVVVHYAGMACDMEVFGELAKKHQLYLIEDAAHALDSYHLGKPLGGIGHLATFSFHETKNIMAGEGGMLVVNDEALKHKAEIIWEKGTNRSAFFRGEVAKYNWVSLGSSFLPSEVTAAFLYAQLEFFDEIHTKRKKLWHRYNEAFQATSHFELPQVPENATVNGHIFYLICKNLAERTRLINYLKSKGILAVFHYLSLHDSPFYKEKHDGRKLPNSTRLEECLLRLPLYYELSFEEQDEVIQTITDFKK